jgi:hypothetical protein
MEPTLDPAAQETPAQYGLEVLCASWNPLAATMSEQVAAVGRLVADQPAVDAEGFLATFYRSQQG